MKPILYILGAASISLFVASIWTTGALSDKLLGTGTLLFLIAAFGTIFYVLRDA